MLVTELDTIVGAPSDNHELIDDTLRSYLRFTTHFKSMYDVARLGGHGTYSGQDADLHKRTTCSLNTTLHDVPFDFLIVECLNRMANMFDGRLYMDCFRSVFLLTL